MGHFRLMLSRVNRVRFDRQPRNFVHRHNFFEPCLVVAGSGEFDHGDAHFPLRTGDLFIADPGVFHEIKSLRTRDLDLMFTAFAVSETTDRTETRLDDDEIIRSFLKRHVVWRKEQQRLRGAFQQLLDWSANGPTRRNEFFRREMMRLLILQIMTALTPASDAPEGSGEKPFALARALREIDARLRGPIWVLDIARSSGVSERSLRRLFQRHLRRTVAEEIQERRVQRAATLLALPEFSVAEAGRQVGIDDPGQFTRLFKKIMGASPREFRDKKIARATRRTVFVPIGGVPMKTEFLDESRT